jgi:long-chain-fatty-acid--CoA ligase ACSBG
MSEIVLVDGDDQLKKILKIKDNCRIKVIVQYKGPVTNAYGGLVISWDEFLQRGESVDDKALQIRIRGIAPNKCATLIYTSGTTGSPKVKKKKSDPIKILSQKVCFVFLGSNDKP